ASQAVVRRARGLELRHPQVPAAHQPAAFGEPQEFDSTTGARRLRDIIQVCESELQCPQLGAAPIEPERALDVANLTTIPRGLKADPDQSGASRWRGLQT